jgi:hypothetical protein
MGCPSNRHLILQVLDSGHKTNGHNGSFLAFYVEAMEWKEKGGKIPPPPFVCTAKIRSFLIGSYDRKILFRVKGI